MTRTGAWRVIAGLGLAGCGVLAGRNARFEASWTGSDRGRLGTIPTGVWCRDARIARITATRGDSGVSLLIRPVDSLVAGRYPIVEPAGGRLTPPAAAVALRMLGSTTVVGYQSQSGALTLEKVEGGRVWGRFEAQAKVATALAGTIQINGRFSAVLLAPGGSACPA